LSDITNRLKDKAGLAKFANRPVIHAVLKLPRDSAICLPVFAHGATEDTIFRKFIGVLR